MDTKAIRARCEAATEEYFSLIKYVHISWAVISQDIPALLDEVERLEGQNKIAWASDAIAKSHMFDAQQDCIKANKRIAELEAAVRGIIAGLNSQRGYYPKTVALLEKAIKGNAIKENKK